MNIPDKFICIIPVRYNSTRFEGKPFALINGKEMIRWVYEHASASSMVGEVVIAAYDEKIENFCLKHNMSVVRVSPDCKNGSEAVASAAKTLEGEWIFEMQGDQPLVTPDIIDDFLSCAQNHIRVNKGVDIIQPFTTASVEQVRSRDVVKVAISKSNRMLLISRHPIESGYRTLGLYVWNKDVLLSFPSMEVTDYEKAEECHLLRFFINDLYVQGVYLNGDDWIEVDRKSQIPEVEQIMKEKGIA